MATSTAQMKQSGPPYQPQTAGLGGVPNKSLDVPITSVFLVLFIIGAVCHMAILQINMRKHHKKFLFSGMLFGFCMARISAMTLRLVWATHLTNIRVAIAAQIFVAAGVILLFIINLAFTQRVIRATHPHFAWKKWFSIVFKLYYASIVCMLVALITSVVQSFYTLDKNIRRIDRDIQLVGSTYFAVGAFLPLPLLLVTFFLPKRSPLEKFGSGRHRTKVYLLVFSSVILTLGAAFRAGIAYVPRPRNNPAWYHSKACFYLFNFTIEIIVVYLYIFIRVDRRFIIPNGSHGPGDYSGKNTERKPSFVERVLSEEQVFDDETDGNDTPQRKQQVPDVENGRTPGDLEKSGEAH